MLYLNLPLRYIDPIKLSDNIRFDTYTVHLLPSYLDTPYLMPCNATFTTPTNKEYKICTNKEHTIVPSSFQMSFAFKAERLSNDVKP